MASVRYVALLRGVSPMNAKMPALARAFEEGGFTDVVTVLGSGNVVFTARRASPPTLARRAERAMEAALDRTFATIVRPIDDLDALLVRDPFAAHRLAAGAKRVVTFLPEAPATVPALPAPRDGARILGVFDDVVLSAYVPGPKGPTFMTLIEKTFGKSVTTRTWDTVRKIVVAAAR